MKLIDKFIGKYFQFNHLENRSYLYSLIKEIFIGIKSISCDQTETPFNKFDQLVFIEMETNRVRDFNEFLSTHKKEEIMKKSKKIHCSKNSKMNTFKNSIGKLFRHKSQSEKSLKHEDLIVGAIPSTIYLTPNASLPRDSRSISKSQISQPIKPVTNVVRHSCSDFACRRSNTFCTYEINNEKNKSKQNLMVNQRLISPPNSAFYSVAMDEYEDDKMLSTVLTVPHSKSVPLHLSQSQQNISQCKKSNIDIQSSAKRNARKKNIFNCSLFRKRSNSRSKSTDKIHLQKPSSLKPKNIPQLNDDPSILTDRCLTLPNLKSSEVDLTSHVGNAQLLSIDLIKDYLNRSDNALPTTIQRNSVDNSSYYQYNSQNHSSSSIQNSPLSLPTRKSVNELRSIDNSKITMYESLILQNSPQNQSFEIKPSVTSAYSDVYNGKNIPIYDSSSLNYSALNSINYNNSVDMSKFVPNTNIPSFVRQISAPQYYSRQIKTKLPHSTCPPTGAVEFWTRPYQEKLKASRRRLLDDKFGSKEALLRSMSPQNLRIYEGESLYDTTYHLHMIPEPPTPVPIDESNNRMNYNLSAELAIRSNPFYSSISQDFHQKAYITPVVENRLLESPIQHKKRQEPIGKTNTITYTDSDDILKKNYQTNEELPKDIHQDEYSNNNNNGNKINKNQKEIEENQKINSIFVQNSPNFEDSLIRIRDLKNIRSSAEFIFTRTPTPPLSFAESSLSSVPPVPKEFLNDPISSEIRTTHVHGNVNLLYSSDNSSVSHEEFADFEQDFFVPVPPPRTDSVLRSIQSKQNNDQDKSELEYDMTDDFLPIFSDSNIDKCDIEQYHKWLEKLPYKLSEFPDILHSRKSAVTAKKSLPAEELIDIVPEKIGLLELKHLKLYRKSIKSWNMSDSSKTDYELTDQGSNQINLTTESNSMKKSFSCDHSLHNSDKAPSIEEFDSEIELSQNLTATESTLLRQYSHLYSLKFSPTQNNLIDSIQSASILKSNRSKSIDLRNFISNNKSRQTVNLSKCSENRKSAPNTKIQLEK